MMSLLPGVPSYKAVRNFGRTDEDLDRWELQVAGEKARYLGSFVELSQFPAEGRPEIAVAGRSNAGKSSLLNSLTGTSVAKISSTPGKTRTLNLFDVGAFYRFVDMPGYGFSKRSGHEQVSWDKMIQSYFSSRDSLVGVLLVVDGRREWSDDEQLLIDYLEHINRPVALALTKVDKLNNSEKANLKKRFVGKDFGVFLVSSLTGEGTKDLEDWMFRQWVKPFLGNKGGKT